MFRHRNDLDYLGWSVRDYYTPDRPMWRVDVLLSHPMDGAIGGSPPTLTHLGTTTDFAERASSRHPVGCPQLQTPQRHNLGRHPAANPLTPFCHGGSLRRLLVDAYLLMCISWFQSTPTPFCTRSSNAFFFFTKAVYSVNAAASCSDLASSV